MLTKVQPTTLGMLRDHLLNRDWSQQELLDLLRFEISIPVSSLPAELASALSNDGVTGIAVMGWSERSSNTDTSQLVLKRLKVTVYW